MAIGMGKLLRDNNWNQLWLPGFGVDDPIIVDQLGLPVLKLSLHRNCPFFGKYSKNLQWATPEDIQICKAIRSGLENAGYISQPALAGVSYYPGGTGTPVKEIPALAGGSDPRALAGGKGDPGPVFPGVSGSEPAASSKDVPRR